ncbi:MAG: hypothetical protein M1829_005522 [Trizodia sp. TS-e1964]|nr:MAG: hypothetical protein M1829_005522 [Trizodia sp. TS-e1964]
MFFTRSPLSVAISLFFGLSATVSAFDPTANTNLVSYYGQGPNQQRLSYFCQNSPIDVIPIAFIDIFPDQGAGGYPGSNFGNQCGSEYYKTPSNQTSQLLSNCPNFVADIPYCQSVGKKILLSIGGGWPQDYKLKNDQSGLAFANFLWGAFGPVDSAWNGPRPFGNAVVDGFDFDIEYNGPTGYAAMITRLRSLYSTAAKTFYISGAPQCIVPDANLGSVINSVVFDFLFVQFYNTDGCSARDFASSNPGTHFTFSDWVAFVKSSANPSTKIFIGLPAAPAAAGGNGKYYLTPSEAKTLINTYKSNSLFGGVMLWESTYGDNNQVPIGSFKRSKRTTISYIVAIKNILVGGATTTTSLAPTTTPCSEDNVLRALLRFDSDAIPFCSTYTPGGTIATIVTDQVSGQMPSQAAASISSACSCFKAYPTPYPANATTTSQTSSTSTSTSSYGQPTSSSSSSLTTSSMSSTSTTSTSSLPPYTTSNGTTTSANSTTSHASTTSSLTTSAMNSTSTTSSTSLPPYTMANSTTLHPPSGTLPPYTTNNPTSTTSSSNSTTSVPPTTSSTSSIPPYTSSNSTTTASITSSTITGASNSTTSGQPTTSTSASLPTTVSAQNSTTLSSSTLSSSSSSGTAALSSSSTGITTSSAPYPMSNSTMTTSSSSSSSPATTDGPLSTSLSSSSSSPATTDPPLSTTSTIYSTALYTITSCAPTVTNCPAQSTLVVTSLIAISTTVCPITALPTKVDAVSASSSPTAQFITTVITTEYVSICPTGFTTLKTTYQATIPATQTLATLTQIPQGWTTTVAVCNNCGAAPTTVTLTVPYQASSAPTAQVTSIAYSSTVLYTTVRSQVTSTSYVVCPGGPNCPSATTLASSSSISVTSVSDAVVYYTATVVPVATLARQQIYSSSNVTSTIVSKTTSYAPSASATYAANVNQFTGAGSKLGQSGHLAGAVLFVGAAVLLL